MCFGGLRDFRGIPDRTRTPHENKRRLWRPIAYTRTRAVLVRTKKISRTKLNRYTPEVGSTESTALYRDSGHESESTPVGWVAANRSKHLSGAQYYQSRNFWEIRRKSKISQNPMEIKKRRIFKRTNSSVHRNECVI